ncbi:MAG: hypothetical protein E7384_07615 [Ruminococcaceae bacterium]|nr:hypothetical protein [Oscillospiraceae bacterium]
MFLLKDDIAGYFSVETALVISAVIMILCFMLSFVLGLFSGIDTLCDKGVDYTGILPVTIHRITNIVTETGGELFAKIS